MKSKEKVRTNLENYEEKKYQKKEQKIVYGKKKSLQHKDIVELNIHQSIVKGNLYVNSKTHRVSSTTYPFPVLLSRLATFP